MQGGRTTQISRKRGFDSTLGHQSAGGRTTQISRKRGFDSTLGHQSAGGRTTQISRKRGFDSTLGHQEGGCQSTPISCRWVLNKTAKKCWCGSMVEQLTCNQQVEGSIPFTSSTQAPYGCLKFMGRLQSGQMQRTVNPSTTSSVVRIHPCPPK